jgi:hypothetical protein
MATRSFLDIIHRVRGDGDDPGDRHGGATGARGEGLPQASPRNFMFATGIECSYPTIDNGRVRRDVMEECGHYARWREDLALVPDLGLQVLRYGLPYYKVHRAPGRYDWEFCDLVLAEMKRLGITPAAFRRPRLDGEFPEPGLPVHFADYAAAVAQRYPWVRFLHAGE